MASETREIDWGTALVEDGNVTVELTGSSSKRWREHFDSVVRLLSHGGNAGWGDVGIAKSAIKVDRLQPGAEADLRHFLESVVVQVNSELAPEASEPEVQASDREPDPQQAADREMAESLRAFGGEPDEQR